MPELPEVEVIARGLRDHCAGARLDRLEMFHPEIVGRLTDEKPEWYCKAVVEKVVRHGKTILLSLEREGERRWAVIRLGMSGQLLKRPRGGPRERHTHAVITFLDRPFELHFRDPRRFGRITLLAAPDAFWQGRDPLQTDAAAFAALLKGRRGRLKGILMNQALFSGIGNIYAGEALFAAGLHPHQPPHRLSRRHFTALRSAVQRVLRSAVRRGGTTIRDFRSLEGLPGRFQHSLKVYGRAGLSCLRPGCKAAVRLLRPAPKAQASFYCPRCQRRV